MQQQLLSIPNPARKICGSVHNFFHLPRIFAIFIALLVAANGTISIRAAEKRLPILFIIADSVSAYSLEPAVGWGDLIPDYFDSKKISVRSLARGGVSGRSFLSKEIWNEAAGQMQPGDFALIQLSSKAENPIDAGSSPGDLPGLGEESKVVLMPTGKTEIVHTFGWYVRKFIKDASDRGATPIVLSGTVHNSWHRQRLRLVPNIFDTWSEEAARQEHSAFIDLAKLLADEYRRLGPDRVKQFFPIDSLRTNRIGADTTASLIVAGIKDIHGSFLTECLSEKGRALVAASQRAKPPSVPES